MRDEGQTFLGKKRESARGRKKRKKKKTAAVKKPPCPAKRKKGHGPLVARKGDIALYRRKEKVGLGRTVSRKGKTHVSSEKYCHLTQGSTGKKASKGANRPGEAKRPTNSPHQKGERQKKQIFHVESERMNSYQSFRFEKGEGLPSKATRKHHRFWRPCRANQEKSKYSQLPNGEKSPSFHS